MKKENRKGKNLMPAFFTSLHGGEAKQLDEAKTSTLFEIVISAKIFVFLYPKRNFVKAVSS